MYTRSALTWPRRDKRFVDTTGRPGPAGWELSTYLEGGRYPVVGISWYEAARMRAFASRLCRRSITGCAPHSRRTTRCSRRPLRSRAESVLHRNTRVGSQPARARALGHISHGRQRTRMGLEFRRRRCSGTRRRLDRVRVEFAADLHRRPDEPAAGPRPEPDAAARRFADQTTLLEPIRLVRDSAFANRAPVSDDAFEAMRFQFTTPHDAPIRHGEAVDESACGRRRSRPSRSRPRSRDALCQFARRRTRRPLQPVVYSGVGLLLQEATESRGAGTTADCGSSS